MILCWYKNCMGGFNTWILDNSSGKSTLVQWASTVQCHESYEKIEQLFCSGNFVEICEREI